jgi:hypothetical protein
MDMSLVKRFTFRERLHIDVRTAPVESRTAPFSAPELTWASRPVHVISR